MPDKEGRLAAPFFLAARAEGACALHAKEKGAAREGHALSMRSKNESGLFALHFFAGSFNSCASFVNCTVDRSAGFVSSSFSAFNGFVNGAFHGVAHGVGIGFEVSSSAFSNVCSSVFGAFRAGSQGQSGASSGSGENDLAHE
ncbi:hypothetical protein [Alteraurantiacibacter aquimixticola]|uniref:hypothetical protein n=1 Tax=Alteraurantiacibacter aquimixticola TaxID=2489173 RepID=UPI00145A18C0|nr:hypothetical protein [Alteraurantiacibacter aquimixticola]